MVALPFGRPAMIKLWVSEVCGGDFQKVMPGHRTHRQKTAGLNSLSPDAPPVGTSASGALPDAGFLQREEKEEGGRHGEPRELLAAQAVMGRVTAETDELSS